jgi:diaminopimelate epimerase
MPLRFTKMHGAGNDFVVLDLRDGRIAAGCRACARIADRHTRRRLRPDPDRRIAAQRRAVASYRIWNADGSPRAMRQRRALHRRLAGARWRGTRLGASPSTARPARMRVERRRCGAASPSPWACRASPAAIPLPASTRRRTNTQLRRRGIEHLRFGAVSMGNPHAVIEVADVDARRRRRIGPRIAAACGVPAIGNVGFAQVLSRGPSACACTSAAWARPWPAAAAPAPRSRCWCARPRGWRSRGRSVALPGGSCASAWIADDGRCHHGRAGRIRIRRGMSGA